MFILESLKHRVIGLNEHVEFQYPCLRVFAMSELRGSVIVTQEFLVLIQGDSIGRPDAVLNTLSFSFSWV